MRSSILAIASIFLLGACTGTDALEELKTTAPKGNDYSTALSVGYKEFAEQKAEAYQWSTSEYFANKGLEAAYGRDVEPEEPTAWPAVGAQPELVDARTQLISAIANNKETQPELTAKAVVAYDRWIVASRDNANAETIKQAQDDFTAALGKIQVAQAADPITKPPSTAPETATSTIIYFPFDSDALGETAAVALKELEGIIKKKPTVTVSINGHTDRAGSEGYNMDLSTRRAAHVMKTMTADGIPENIMKYFAFGETDPAVPTEDGVREAKNRRVEIYLEPITPAQ